MKLNSAIIKLTSIYVGIIMLISIGFSISIYKISSKEIDNGLGRQGAAIREFQTGRMLVPISDQLEDLRREQISATNDRLSHQLYYFNLLILVLSAVGSYFLAKKTLKPIEDMLEAQERFTADASHELKTPLTAMKTEIEVSLRGDKLSLEDSRELLKSNLEEIGKLETLSSALLKLTRFSENAKVEMEKVSLNEILVDAFNKIKSLADKKEIDVVLKGIKDDSHPVIIRADKASLTEVFVILFDNAIKYSPKKSKVTARIEEKGTNIRISILDNGIGIKASDLHHIFDRFYRADQSRNKDQVSGYGLGLSIAKRIIDIHKGKLLAESKIGRGSTFTIELKHIINE